MGKFTKNIELENGKIEYVGLYAHTTYQKIVYYVLNNEKEIKKKMVFSVWSDFSFNAWEENVEQLDNIDFEIDKKNPMYISFERLLSRNNGFFSINDESISDSDKKKITICQEDENIKVKFENTNENVHEDDDINKFMINLSNDEFNKNSATDESSTEKRKQLKLLYDDLQLTIAPKETLNNILIPKNTVGKLNLKKAQKEKILRIIPELKAEVGFDQKNPWHIYDVWEHTLVALEKTPQDLEIRLAMLLHDIGKPYSYQVDGELRHFKGHPEKSEEIARPILERLGYSAEEQNTIAFLIKYHASVIDLEKVNIENIEKVKKLLIVQNCDANAYNPQYSGPAIRRIQEIKAKLIKKERDIKAKQVKCTDKSEDERE